MPASLGSLIRRGHHPGGPWLPAHGCPPRRELVGLGQPRCVLAFGLICARHHTSPPLSMKCFEVVLNGGEPLVVGAAGAPLIGGSLSLFPSGKGGLFFSAHVSTGAECSETRTWSLMGLKVGDELRVSIVEADQS